MRRVGLVLAGLGTCLIVFAVLMATWVTGRVTKFPLNEYVTVTLTDPSASYFSASKLTPMTGVNMEAVYTIKGNAAAGNSSTAVWNQFIYVYDQTNKLPVQTTTRTFAFDRRTAQLVNCCGANVNGDSSIEQRGYVGYVLPIGTKKQTYDVFDTNLNKPVPFVFTGVGDAGGTQAYKFTANVPPTQNGTQTVPGSLVGQSAASVTLPQYYEVHTTYWIDPVTGALLNVTQHEKLTLRNTDGSQALLLFDANLAATQSSVDNLVAHDNNELSKASLVGTLLPLGTGLAGLLLLIIGIFLYRRPERGVEAASSLSSSGPAAAEPRAAERSAHVSLVPGLDDEPREATVESPVVKESAVKEEAAAGAVAGAAAASAGAKAAEGDARAAEAKAEDKAAEAQAEPAQPAAAAEAAEAKAEAAQADAAAEDAKAGAEAKAEAAEAQAEDKAPEAAGAAPAGESSAAADASAEAKTEDAPAEAATAEMPAADADTAESSATDATAETSAQAGTSSRRRRGTHRR